MKNLKWDVYVTLFYAIYLFIKKADFFQLSNINYLMTVTNSVHSKISQLIIEASYKPIKAIQIRVFNYEHTIIIELSEIFFFSKVSHGNTFFFYFLEHTSLIGYWTAKPEKTTVAKEPRDQRIRRD